MNRIYFDHNATTALDPSVLETMVSELRGPPANPSSTHYFGKKAKAALTKARELIASYFSVKPEALIFTSGATESLNALLRSLFGSRPKGHLVTTALEHSAVYETVRYLEGTGLSVSFVPVDSWGAPRVEAIEEAIQSDTRAIVLSAANTETGVKLDIEAIAALAERRGIPLILDAVAFIGKEPWIMYSGISALAFSGHKFHGPKGIGGMVIRPDLKFSPLITGGGQESLRRSGTEFLAGILGLARAFEILIERQPEITAHLSSLRDHLEKGLLREFSELQINGEGPRISNTSNLFFPGVDGETLLMHLDMAGVAASHGSACSSGALEPSRVLQQMGFPLRRVRSSLRFSLGRMNTLAEVDACIERTSEIISKFYTQLV